MAEKILCVDDEPKVLFAYQRSLRKQFQIETAAGGQEALELLRRDGPYAVIVSDMRMPGMDGIELLKEVRRLAPDCVRMMLTGNADQKTATDAVNEGQIFRFLTKPCSPGVLAKSLETGIEQYRLITAEKELLEKTLKGSVKVLSDVLALVNPTAFGRASRTTRLVAQFARELELEQSWHLEVATMLSQLGCVTLPEETLYKVYQGISLSAEEAAMFQAHPRVGSELIENIPRLESVVEIIACQERHFDGSGFPPGPPRGEKIPLGARILKLLFDYDTRIAAGCDGANALAEIRSRKGVYDPELIDAFERMLGTQARNDVRFIKAHELAPGMILDQDLKTVSGVLLVAKGQEVTGSLCTRLKNFARTGKGIQEPIKVIIVTGDVTAGDETGRDESTPNEKAA